jgi:predicted transcriptional regulator
MAHNHIPALSRRERQIMDILFKRARATAAEIHRDLPDRPSYSAVRAHLRTLEDKGHVRHAAEDLRYVYLPRLSTEKARRGALAHLVETFFAGSPGRAAAALLDSTVADFTSEELDRLAVLVEEARRKGA